MAALSNVLPASVANYDSQYDLHMVRVRSKKEREIFARIRQHLLNKCTDWCEAGHNVQSSLPTLLILNAYLPRFTLGTWI